MQSILTRWSGKASKDGTRSDCSPVAGTAVNKQWTLNLQNTHIQITTEFNIPKLNLVQFSQSSTDQPCVAVKHVYTHISVMIQCGPNAVNLWWDHPQYEHHHWMYYSHFHYYITLLIFAWLFFISATLKRIFRFRKRGLN